MQSRSKKRLWNNCIIPTYEIEDNVIRPMILMDRIAWNWHRSCRILAHRIIAPYPLTTVTIHSLKNPLSSCVESPLPRLFRSTNVIYPPCFMQSWFLDPPPWLAWFHCLHPTYVVFFLFFFSCNGLVHITDGQSNSSIIPRREFSMECRLWMAMWCPLYWNHFSSFCTVAYALVTSSVPSWNAFAKCCWK